MFNKQLKHDVKMLQNEVRYLNDKLFLASHRFFMLMEALDMDLIPARNEMINVPERIAKRNIAKHARKKKGSNVQ